MSYCIRLPADLDPQLALPKLRLLEEEEPAAAALPTES